MIGQTVNRFANEAIKVIRYDGFYDAGRFERRLAVARTIKANVQPARPDDLDRLPENYRKQGAIEIFTLELLRTGSASNDPNAPGVVADRVEFLGVEYEIATVERWRRHYRYIATRSDQ